VANSLNTFTATSLPSAATYGFRFERHPAAPKNLSSRCNNPTAPRAVDIRTLPFVRSMTTSPLQHRLYGVNLGEGVNRVGPDSSIRSSSAT